MMTAERIASTAGVVSPRMYADLCGEIDRLSRRGSVASVLGGGIRVRRCDTRPRERKATPRRSRSTASRSTRSSSDDGPGEPPPPPADPLTAGQRAVLEALQGHCFNGPTCWPSQELVARETGYTREFVNRAIKHLERIGELTIAKAQRIGAKWAFNVYTLASWTKPLRRRTLAILDAIRGRDHTKRTTTSGTRSTGDAGAETALSSVRCGRARERAGRPRERDWEAAWAAVRFCLRSEVAR